MDKGAYRKKAEAKIEEQLAKLDQLRAQAKGASADAQLEAGKQINDLESALKAAQRKLEDLGDAAEDAWEDAVKGFDRAVEDVGEGARKLLSRFS